MKGNKKIQFIYGLFSLVFFLGCTETPVPIPEFELPNTDRVVLIEYLTGVKCPNCPKATAVLKNIESTFPGKTAVVAIHGRLQTEPLKESKFDFRAPIATQLENFHSPFLGKPSALLNRNKFIDEPFKPVDLVDLWPSYIQEILQQEDLIDILLSTQYNPTTRIVTLQASLLPKNTISKQMKISVFVTEGEIIDAQETIGSIIAEYKHENILRAMLTNVAGDDIQEPLVKASPLLKSYSYTIPETFKPENMEIVIAIADATTGNIDQAAKVKIIQ